MPGSSLFALLDDVATVLDDVAVLTKTAAQKTAGVLGDDLALNAQQVAGVRAERELPVVWAVAKGSAVNKLVLVPSALAVSALAPWAVTPLLMVGGAYLCFEGFEKVAHALLHADEKSAHEAALKKTFEDPTADLAAFEADKIKGAVRTDFVLSAEIVAITLGTVATASFGVRVVVLGGIAAIMTVGVYGFVAAIVKIDDVGAALCRRVGDSPGARAQRSLGRGILRAAPFLMKGLSLAGTVAMFLVGGGILTHGVPGAHDAIHHVAHAAGAAPAVGGLLEAVVPTVLDGLAGVVAGALLVGVVSVVQRLRSKSKDPARPSGDRSAPSPPT